MYLLMTHFPDRATATQALALERPTHSWQGRGGAPPKYWMAAFTSRARQSPARRAPAVADEHKQHDTEAEGRGGLQNKR